MTRSNIKITFHCDKNKLWDKITDNNNYAWRSDISRIEIIDDTHFVEYTKKIIQHILLFYPWKS